MSKYGDPEWRLREANELKNRRGVTTLYLPGGRVWCTIRDGECPRPGPGFQWAWRCPCRGARCCFGGGGRGGDAPPPTYGGRSHFQSIQTEVATSEAGTVVSASRFPNRTESLTGFHPPATISSGEDTAKEACCELEGSKEYGDCPPPKVTKCNDAHSNGCGLGGGGRGGDAVLAVALPAPRNRCPQDMVHHVALHHEEALRLQRVRTRVEAEVEATTIPGGGDDDSTRQFRGLLFLSAELDLASNGPGRSWRAGI